MGLQQFVTVKETWPRMLKDCYVINIENKLFGELFGPKRSEENMLLIL